MEYTKPALDFEKQADLIISRGLIANRSTLISVLQNVNYYRFSGYLYPFRILPGDNYNTGTTFEQVWRHYTFDRRLRLITMDAVERFEVSIKTQIVNCASIATGAFGYTNPDNFPNLTAEEYATMLMSITNEVSKSREIFVKHFNKKYGDTQRYMPMWMMGEIISFGCAITMFKGMEIKNIITDHYGVPEDVLLSWLKTINVIRNICAHHSRLWNRTLGVKPLIPRINKYPQWHDPVVVGQDKVFGILTILNYLLNIAAPNSKWKKRFFSLLDEYPDIAKQSMGFPDNWKDSPLWN